MEKVRTFPDFWVPLGKFRATLPFLLPLLILAFLAISFRHQLAYLPLLTLMHRDEPKPGADAIIFLLGDPGWRVIETARLMKLGIAPRILIAHHRRASHFQDIRKGLAALGIPAERIHAVTSHRPVESTAEEAQLHRKYFDSVGLPQRIVVTTSWHHTNRAKWVFEKAFAGTPTRIETSAAGPPPIFWWRDENEFTSVFLEHVKWLYYLVHFSFRSLPNEIDLVVDTPSPSQNSR